MGELDEALRRLERSTAVTMATARAKCSGRAAEHVAGLDAARRAFDRARSPGSTVLGREADGRPCWPRGWTGSIAHTDGVAIAAVSRLSAHRAVGVDIERDGALHVDDAELVLGQDERTWAEGRPDPASAATLLWSAKESAFKAWSTASEGLRDVDPLDIHIAVSDDERVRAVAAGPLRASRFARPLVGAFTIVVGMVVTVLVHCQDVEGRSPGGTGR